MLRRLAQLGLLALIATGCDAFGTCTDAGCDDATLMIVTGWDGEGLSDGVYEIELTLDDQPFSIVCDMSQPNTSCETSGDTSPRAVVDGRGRIQIRFDGTPANYNLRVETPSGDAVSDMGTLTYEESRPNGPNCEPVCQTAVEDLLLEIAE